MTLQLAGRRFGSLFVTERVNRRVCSGRSRRFWQCVCDCGRLIWIEASNLTTGNSTTCGTCWRGTHRHTKHEWQSRTYKTWASMLSRCYNSNYDGYARYGARGIKVYRRWHKFENFLRDMGERPVGKTIERINNTKGYFPSNCCWATPAEQAKNRRTTKLSIEKATAIRKLYKRGVIKAELARKFEVSFSAIVKVLDGSRWAEHSK
jgi:hypothetical protein